MFVERRSLVEQRLRRDPRFVSSIAARSATPQSTLHQRFEITRIEALLGVSGERCVFGMLTQLEDGVWFIEDENASIRADLSKFLSLEVRYMCTRTCTALTLFSFALLTTNRSLCTWVLFYM
jgi:DNA polymerase epsilon subunit 2